MAPPKQPIRTVVVEDSPGLASSVDHLLKIEVGIEVARRPLSSRAALGWSWGIADIAIVDLDLEEMPGLELIARLKHTHPQLRMLVLTGENSPHSLTKVLRAGAAGYLFKSDMQRLLSLAVRLVAQGGLPLSPGAAQWNPPEQEQPPHPMAGLLSQRETQVLGAISKGMAYKEVAFSLGLSSHTVHAHVRNIYAKLQITDRREAIVLAREIGCHSC
jgi:DNA-binding NarL/FixJ family response regulator